MKSIKQDTNKSILNILKKTGAVITNSHFVYTSGKHGSVYINKDQIYIHTKQASKVGRLFAQKTKNLDIDVVAAPALGGIILSQWTAYHLSLLNKREVLGIYTEKTPEGEQVLKRGYDQIVKNKKVLIVEDMTTTGGSVKKVVNSIRQAKGKVIAVGVMINRNPDMVNKETIGAPFFCLGVLKADAFEAKNCPFCQNNIPINTKIGHGKKYLDKKKLTRQLNTRQVQVL